MSTRVHSYDAEQFKPPAPALKVKVSKPFSTFSVERKGKIDCGADKTVIPLFLVWRLELVPAREVTVCGFRNREGRKTPTFYVDISIGELKFDFLEVISAPRENILIGRDILNSLKILLDGKNLSFEISDP
jgi:hypothetical protein